MTPAEPRPAATLLLLRDGPSGLEVLMIARHADIAFAGGALVFPGGRVEAADAMLAGPSEAHRVAAIRETWEETGILLATAGTNTVTPDTPFSAHLCQAGLLPDLAALVPFAHWITPVQSPKRFDTQFFAAIAPDGAEPQHDGQEAVEALWIRPQDAVAAAAVGERKLLFVTRMNLQRLACSASASAAMVAAAASPIVPVTPEPFTDGQGGTLLRIPEAAGYGGSIFPASELPAMGSQWHHLPIGTLS